MLRGGRLGVWIAAGHMLLAPACVVARYPDPGERADAEAIVVLGKRPPLDRQGVISDELRRRVERGVELYREGRAPELVLSGGRTTEVVEAQVMRSYALAQGVPEAAIRVEERSGDTIGNARWSYRLLCAGRPSASCRPRVILVTSPYHIGRAERLFRCAGFDVRSAVSAPGPGLGYALGGSAYETGMRIVYWFRDACSAAGSAQG